MSSLPAICFIFEYLWFGHHVIVDLCRFCIGMWWTNFYRFVCVCCMDSIDGQHWIGLPTSKTKWNWHVFMECWSNLEFSHLFFTYVKSTAKFVEIHKNTATKTDETHLLDMVFFFFFFVALLDAKWSHPALFNNIKQLDGIVLRGVCVLDCNDIWFTFIVCGLTLIV